MTKTKNDLMLATYRLIFDQTNPAAMEEFKEDALPSFLRNCPSLSEPITDEEFDREVAKIRDNLPGIIEYLRHRPLPAALTPDHQQNFPPGDFVIGDDAQIERILAELGLLKLMTDPPQPAGTRTLYYEGHPTHWLVIAAHDGYPEPEKNGYEIFGLCRRSRRSDQARRDADEISRRLTLGNATAVGMHLLPYVD